MKPQSFRFNFAIATAIAFTVLIAIVVSEPASAALSSFLRVKGATTTTWDGGGATNNWSEGANWSGDVAPGPDDDAVFDATSTKDATVDGNFNIRGLNINAGYVGTITQADSTTLSIGVSLFFVNSAQGAGTFVCGVGSTIVFNAVNFTQTGGSFNCQNGTINSSFFNLFLNAGTFNAPSGTMTVGTTNVESSFVRQPGAIFNHNNGTVAFQGGPGNTNIFVGGPVGSTLEFGNLTINTTGVITPTAGANRRLVVNGILNLTDGDLSVDTEARGAVNIANTFGVDTPGNTITGSGKLMITGPPRTVTFPALTNSSLRYNPLELNSPNSVLNASGATPLKLSNLTLVAGTFNAGSTPVTIFSNLATQVNSIFNCNTATVLFSNPGFGSTALTMDGGLFDCENGNFNSNADVQFTLNAGTFEAPSGTMTLTTVFGTNFVRQPSAIFNHNNGTVIFSGRSALGITLPEPAGVQEFFNLRVDLQTADLVLAGSGGDQDRLRVLGQLNLNSGNLQNGTVEAHGNVTVGSGFVNGSLNGGRLAFAGSNDQIFTNNGGGNPRGVWTINKPSGVVTAASSMILQPTQQLLIQSGKLYLNANSNLTAGLIGIGAPASLVNDSSTTITIGQGLDNSGTLDLNGSGAGCPGADTILIRSTTVAQRTWQGNGRYRLIDVDVQNMASSRTVYSGTNSGGNSAGWVFVDGCPPELSLSPSVAGVPAGQGQNFTAAGGFPPYTFSLAVNNSGGTIEPPTGNYTAGPTMGVSDTIRVTDVFGATAEATVNVVGAPTKLGFIVQPSNTSTGQTITPAVKVAAQDANGNTVTTINPNITISIASNPSGGTLSGTLTRQASFGVATFDNLSIDAIGNGYTLRATNIGLAPGASNGFNIGAGVPAKLTFTVQPTNTSTGEMIAPPVQVAIQDAFGNLVATANDPVTIALANNPSGGLLSGTLTRSANGGIAIFNDLSIDSLGNGYTLSATSVSLIPGTSTAFNIDPPFVVTNTNDSGPGSLRQIITDANNTPGRQTVRFNIAGTGPFSIAPVTRLPNITQPLIIDGSTQPGFSGTPIIELNGGSSSSGAGLYIFDRNAGSPGSIIKSLIVNGWGTGISLDGNGTTGGNNRIQGCYIGTDASGSMAVPNNTGIHITSTSLDLIGGLTAAEGNVISGNNASGVTLINTREVVIQGNRIGTQANGASPLPNVRDGITFVGNSVENNKVGGVETGAGNVIAFNGRSGVRFANGIGTGILFGVRMVGNQIVGNSIFSNGNLGISLQVSYASPVQNDPTDVDDGANLQQNFPNLLSASPLNGTTRIEGSLNSRPSSSYRLEFFSNPTCGRYGHGEGKTLIGTMNVMTDAGGIADISSLPPLPVLVPNGHLIAATATDAQGNTSEFSNCTVVSDRYRISGSVTKAGVPLSNAQVWLMNTQSLPLFRTTLTNSLGNYSLEFIQPADHTLYVVYPNLTFTPPSRFYPSLSQDQTNQNFASGTPQSFTIRGRARTNATGSTVSGGKSSSNAMPPVPAGGFPLLGVNFNITGPGINRNVTNDTFGNYRFDALPPGGYFVTPTKPNYVFNPPVAGITIGGGDQAVDFDGTSLDLSTLSGRIVYDSLGGIKAMNADGSGVVTLSPNSTRIAAHIMPRLSENGQRIVFVTRSTTNPENRILAIGADGTGRDFLFTQNSRLFSPVPSPNGSRVAFHDSSEGLVIMNSDGSGVQSIVGNCMEPDWSPDGTQIVCIEEVASTTDRVKTINLNAGTQTTLDSSSGRKFSPRWSPDGTKIAFLRRQSGTPSVHSIVVKTILGGTDTILTGNNGLNQSLTWSPDGVRLAFVRDTIAPVARSARPPGVSKQLVTVQAADGQNMLVIVDGFDGTKIDWGMSNSFSTPGSPAPTTINSGAISITFPGTTGANGITTITPIEPNSAGSAPNGFVIGNFAFEISTTAGFTPPVTICVDLDTPGVQRRQMPPASPALMHNENGVLVNITTSYNETTGILCGQANSFSPFVVAEQIDAALASINGLVIDSNGAPMSGVAVDLTGAQTGQTRTDSNGLFRFVNLTNGGNYNLQPQSVGYLFAEYSQDFLAVTGEHTIVFTGTQSDFQIGGRVADSNGNAVAGVAMVLEGAGNDEVLTDAGGNYLFTGLPADGSYFVRPSGSGFSFSPGQRSVGALTSDVDGMDFTAFAPTAASVSVAGRVLTAEGHGIGKARVSIADSNGNIRNSLTNPFGYYRFDQVEVGGIYIISVETKRYQFEVPVRTLSVIDELTDVDFTALPGEIGAIDARDLFSILRTVDR